MFGFEVDPHVHALSALRKDRGSGNNNDVSPLMDGRAKKEVAAARFLRGDKLTYTACFISYTTFRPIATEAITIKSSAKYSKAVALSSMLRP